MIRIYLNENYCYKRSCSCCDVLTVFTYFGAGDKTGNILRLNGDIYTTYTPHIQHIPHIPYAPYTTSRLLSVSDDTT